ncbi:MAG: ferredoxin [Intestinibacter sp.]|uniref:ferredoxin n=1 Tax=Intestinibacter sp. TaxID=1965304 RepID=UPI002A816DAE|nr:ferredoxin [Intestinibacter sp.]MDY4575734.1 ferredoxin [Intestinibacter sp.]
MKARVDRDTCIGCGLCPAICPEVFELTDEGYAHAIESEVPEDCYDEAMEAAESCPVDAIEVEK